MINNVNSNITNLLDKNSETEFEIRNNMSKKKFFSLIAKENIELDNVVNKKKSNNLDFHKFNCLVRKLYEKKVLSMIEMAIFLYTDLFEENTILECFNEDNMHELRLEFSQKYNIKMDTNILKDFLC